MSNCKECFYCTAGFCYKYQEPLDGDEHPVCFVKGINNYVDAVDLDKDTGKELSIKIYRHEVTHPVTNDTRYVYHVYVNDEFTQCYDTLYDLQHYLCFISDTHDYANWL